MLPFLQFLLILAIIITAAKVGGYISMRINQPAVAGEVLAGLILGPTVINILHWDIFTVEHLHEMFVFLAELGALLLLFIAGLELHLEDLQRSGSAAIYAGVLGFAIPLGLGYLAATSMGFATKEGIFIGLLLAPTSVSISAQTLMELKVLRTRVGASLLGAAVIDDTLVVLGVSIFLAAYGGQEAAAGGAEVAGVVVSMIVYLAAALGFGVYALPKLLKWVRQLPISKPVITFAFITMVFFAWAAEYWGHMSAIIGAFIAGLVFGRTPLKSHIDQGLSPIAYAVFVPIFFVEIGLEANLAALDQASWVLLLVLLVTAIVSKIIGAGLGGSIGKLSRKEAWQLGFSMTPRGEVVLIVAAVGIAEGFIDQAVLSVAVAMVILTTLLTPSMLRGVFRRSKDAALIETEPMAEA